MTDHMSDPAFSLTILAIILVAFAAGLSAGLIGKRRAVKQAARHGFLMGRTGWEDRPASNPRP